MAAARRTAQRQQALDISNCVSAAFDGKRVEWDDWLKTGAWTVWGRYPLPMNAAISAEIERLTAHEKGG